MNKAQIKAELRRSACEDAEPVMQCVIDIKDWSVVFRGFRTFPNENINLLSIADQRTFFLLVAEAL